MRKLRRISICTIGTALALASFAEAQISSGTVTVSCAAIGGNTVWGGTTVSLECFITNTSSGGSAPLGIRGGQVDMANDHDIGMPGNQGYPFSGGGTLAIVPGAEGGTTDPDGDTLRGPSAGGLPFLFGPMGLGPYRAATATLP